MQSVGLSQGGGGRLQTLQVWADFLGPATFQRNLKVWTKSLAFCCPSFPRLLMGPVSALVYNQYLIKDRAKLVRRAASAVFKCARCPISHTADSASPTVRAAALLCVLGFCTCVPGRDEYSKP